MLGQEGEELGQRPVDRQAPTASAEVGVRVAFEDCAGDGILFEGLGEQEAGDAGADDEDVRLLRLLVGNCGGCHFGLLVLTFVMSLVFLSIFLLCFTTSRLTDFTRMSLNQGLPCFGLCCEFTMKSFKAGNVKGCIQMLSTAKDHRSKINPSQRIHDKRFYIRELYFIVQL